MSKSESGGTPTLELSAVRREFGRVVAVQNVNFAIQPGEFVGLVGPNGAGKSTTIKMVAGQLRPTSGQIRVAGIDVWSDPNAARAQIGYVPEEPRLYDYLNAREMIAFIAEIRGRGDIEAALAIANLGEGADRLIREYSQGMRRRTALACAMVAEPPLLILDESLNGLDPPSAQRVVTALRAACDRGASVLLSTHILDTLEKIADRIVMISKGEVVADVAPTELDRVRSLFSDD